MMKMYVYFLFIFSCVGYVITVPISNETFTIHSVLNRDNTSNVEEQSIESLPKPESVIDRNWHRVHMGQCQHADKLLHSETIIVNSNSNSRQVGSIRVQVEADVSITCAKVIDQNGINSGAYASIADGGIGKNYVVFNFLTAEGAGFNFLIELYGDSIQKDLYQVQTKNNEITNQTFDH